MTGLIEMMLLKAMSASAAHEESRRRKRQKTGARAITCAVCHTYGGTMYKRGSGYICRDCRRKEKKK